MREGNFSKFTCGSPLWSPLEEGIALRREAPVSTILLAEENTDVLRFVCDLLTDCGYRVFSASSHQEAIGICENEYGPINMLITNIGMNRPNGAELARRFLKFQPEATVLFTSGGGDDDCRSQFAGHLKVRFLAKPYLPSKLMEIVQMVMGDPNPAKTGVPYAKSKAAPVVCLA
jgi:CheY-like chemotaxis protein